MASRTTGLGQRSWAWPRVDPRFVLAVALLAVGVLAGMAVVREARITEPLVVAARPIPPGHVLTADDLTLAEARLEGPPAALAIAWVCTRPGVSVAIAGAKRPAQVEQNVRAVELLSRHRLWEALAPHVDACRP